MTVLSPLLLHAWRHRFRYTTLAIVSALCLSVFLGWKHSSTQIADPEKFIFEYEKSAGIKFDKNGFRVVILPVNSDYLRAKRTMSGGRLVSKEEAARLITVNSFSVMLIIEPLNASARPGNDMLNASMTEGKAAFRKRLQLLSDGLADFGYIRTRSGEEKKALMAYYQRTWGVGTGEAILFLFPTLTPVPGDIKFVLEDAGLPIGKIETTIKPLPRMEFIP